MNLNSDHVWTKTHGASNGKQLVLGFSKRVDGVGLRKGKVGCLPAGCHHLGGDNTGRRQLLEDGPQHLFPPAAVITAAEKKRILYFEEQSTEEIKVGGVNY